MRPSLQKMYAELAAGKSVKAILNDCLLVKSIPSHTSLFAHPNFNATINATKEALNKNTASDHQAILQALLRLTALPATLAGQMLDDFLTLFPIYQPLMQFTIKDPSPFEAFAHTAISQLCWDDNYEEAAESFAAFAKQLPATDLNAYKKRFVIALANARSEQEFRDYLSLLPHFIASFKLKEVRAISYFLMMSFPEKSVLAHERIITALGLCATRLTEPAFSTIITVLFDNLNLEQSPLRVRLAAFNALMKNSLRIKAVDSLLEVQFAWLTSSHLECQMAALDALPKLIPLALPENKQQALLEYLCDALVASNPLISVSSMEAFAKVSPVLGPKRTLAYLKNAIALFNKFNETQKEFFLSLLPHIALPTTLHDPLRMLVNEYVKTHDANTLYPVIALFYPLDSNYQHYWKFRFKNQNSTQKIADCQLFQALWKSTNALTFLTVLGALQTELMGCTDPDLLVCIAETLAACQGRLSNQQCHAYLALLLPHLQNAAPKEELVTPLVTLLSGSEPPERYQAMALLHRLGTKSSLSGFLKLNALQQSFQLEECLPLSPRVLTNARSA